MTNLGETIQQQVAALGPNLRDIRERQGRTILVVAHLAGLDQRYLTLVEQGTVTPPLIHLLAICGVLGVSVGEVVRL